MTGKLFLASALVFAFSISNAAEVTKPKDIGANVTTTNAVEPKIEYPKVIETFEMSGRCPKVEYEKTKACTDNAGADYTETFTFYKFEAKASKDVKTTARACSKLLIEAALKLPEHDVSRLLTNPDKIDRVKLFRIENCTLIENSPTTPKLAVIELEQVTTKEDVKKENKEEDDLFHRKIIFVKVDNQNTPQKIIKVIHSSSIFSTSRESYSVKKICDADGDGRAEVILSLQELLPYKYAVANIDAKVDEVVIDTWLIDQECDHTSGD